ncbi:hypothetical protein Tco_0103580 [Tanacetum coccineum]
MTWLLKSIPSKVRALRYGKVVGALFSEEIYFRKAVNFLSSKSLKHKDHGNISVIETISEAFKEKNPKHNIAFSIDKLNPPSDPSREFIDEEVLSTSQTESSRDLIQAELTFGFLVGTFSSLNKYIRTSSDSSTYGYDLMEIQKLLQVLHTPRNCC